ncbi:MAG: glutathione S-transferase family protein [Alphaproteobacteria bacterium]|nr:glutathione S-transferase family protein [Alphaproteobacteria bacterium]
MDRLTLVIGNKNYSSWSLRPWLALAVAGIPFDEIVIPLYRDDTKALLARHAPAGKVPVLRDGAIVVWESLAILAYLAKRHPEAGLWPDQRAARAHALAASHEMHAGFAALRRAMPMNCRRRARPLAAIAPEVAADIDRVTALWGECRRRFGAGGPFLHGRFGIADAMYAPVVTRFASYAVALDPVAAAYRDAILALPAMRRWYEDAAAEPDVVAGFEL